MTNQSTYDLIQSANDLIGLLWALQGEVDDETESAVDQWLEDCPDKIGAIAAAKRRIKDDVASLKAEEDRIKDRRKTLEKSVERVSQLALGLLQAHEELTGETKIKRADLTAWIATTKSVEISDEDAIPSAFLVTTTRPNKTAIGKTLKGGEDVPGCELVDKTGARFR